MGGVEAAASALDAIFSGSDPLQTGRIWAAPAVGTTSGGCVKNLGRPLCKETGEAPASRNGGGTRAGTWDGIGWETWRGGAGEPGSARAELVEVSRRIGGRFRSAPCTGRHQKEDSGEAQERGGERS
jgi:hypothetical protein